MRNSLYEDLRFVENRPNGSKLTKKNKGHSLWIQITLDLWKLNGDLN